MSATLSEKFLRARRALQRRRWLAAALTLAAGAILLLWVPAAINRASPMQEQNAFLVLAAILTAGAGVLGWLSWRIGTRPPGLPDLAARLEDKDPKWMDALICATELEQKPESERRSLERALIAQVRSQSAEIDFDAALIPPRWKPKPLFAAFGGMVVLAVLLTFTGFFQKGRAYFGDLVNGASTGLLVSPGNTEKPIRSDVSIHAKIRRWEKNAEIEYIDQTGRHRFPMHRNADGHSFTFYDIQDTIQYRVITPSLRSNWYQVASYIPPAIENIQVRVQPPAYTGLPEETYDRLDDLAPVQGSVITWELTSPTAATAQLRAGSRSLAAESDRPGRFTLTLTASESFQAYFVIADVEDRTARTNEFQVQVRPDQAPTVEITQPGRDTQAPPDGEVSLTALAADDFGLTSAELHVSVSGERQEPIRLFYPRPDSPERVTEQTLQSVLDLHNLAVQEGDVVVYFITATDNREPDPQQARSEIYFIEIREQVTPDEMEGQPMELEQVDLNALIVEMKRLIRLSWTAAAEKDARLEREIVAALEEARLETASIEQKIIEQVGAEAAAPAVALLNRAMQRMESAGNLVDQSLVEDAIPYEEMALADLVAIQTALEKNQSRSRQPSESSSGGQPPPPEPPREESLEALRELVREVRRLADDQAVQNSAMRRAPPGGLSEEQRQELRRRQQDIQQRAERITRSANQTPGGQGALGELAAASSSMETAGTRLEANDPSAAAGAGDRARASLLAALDSLEQAVNDAAGNQISQLAQQASQLAQQQSAAAGSTRGLAQSESPSPEEGAALRAEQESLQQQLEDLLGQIADTANQLRSENPEAAQALAEAASGIQERNTVAEMGRAGNALLYRRYDRAAEIQEGAAASLGDFANALDESSRLLPSLSREQLHEMLARVRQAEQEMTEMFGQSPDQIAERLQQMAERLGSGLDRAAGMLRDQTLQEVSGEIGAAARGETGPNLFRMTDLLRAAGRSLEQHILALEIERRTRLQRQVSEPPERYRTLVEEYFKDLSETP